MENRNPSAAALMQLLLGGSTAQMLDTHRELIFAAVPELETAVCVPQNNPYHNRGLWAHTLCAVSQVPPDLSLRMAALLHDIGKITTRTTDAAGVDHFYGHSKKSVAVAAEILRRLGLPKSQAEEILTLIALHDVVLSPTEATWRKLKKTYSAALLTKLLLLKRADILAQNPDKLGTRITQLYALREDLAASETPSGELASE